MPSGDQFSSTGTSHNYRQRAVLVCRAVAQARTIGENCIIAGQVGFAGSSTLGNNVKIGGRSGVVKDIEDNQIVMGYPAVPFKDFIKDWKK